MDTTHYNAGIQEAEARLRMIHNLTGPDRQAAQEQLAGFLSVLTGADVSEYLPARPRDTPERRTP